MVAVPGIMGEMSLATAKAVGYKDYTIVSSSTVTEQQVMVAVPGVMGQMSLATAKAVGYTDYTIVSSGSPSTVPQPESSLNLVVSGSGYSAATGATGVIGGTGAAGPTGASDLVQSDAGVGWPLRQIEIGLGAAVFVLLTLIIFASRRRIKEV